MSSPGTFLIMWQYKQTAGGRCFLRTILFPGLIRFITQNSFQNRKSIWIPTTEPFKSNHIWSFNVFLLVFNPKPAHSIGCRLLPPPRHPHLRPSRSLDSRSSPPSTWAPPPRWTGTWVIQRLKRFSLPSISLMIFGWKKASKACLSSQNICIILESASTYTKELCFVGSGQCIFCFLVSIDPSDINGYQLK